MRNIIDVLKINLLEYCYINCVDSFLFAQTTSLKSNYNLYKPVGLMIYIKLFCGLSLATIYCMV